LATITLRLNDTTRDEVEDLARANGLTVSELLRAAIEEMLGRGVATPRIDVPRSLDLVQRRSLALLHEILARLDSAGDADDDPHRRQIDVLNGGYTGEYANEFVAIQPELSHADCQLVWEILDMFRVIRASTDRLGEAKVAALGDHAVHALTFQGFDANHSFEGRLRSYARHLIETGRWEELADRFDDERERGNSHIPMLATYQRMLAVFMPTWERKVSSRGYGPERLHLTVKELRDVLAAWSYLPEELRDPRPAEAET